jgi:flavin reductase (DIM6/NTAB) family NADH-FMN oxidoreductase RutF
VDDDIHFYEPARGHGLRHDPFNAIVGPRPIGWISTLARDGTRNLAPYSFFNGFCYRPPIVGFSSIGWKDSVRNCRDTGEFVWNLATRELAERMNQTSAMFGPEVDEFAVSGLTPAASRVVGPPRVGESPVSFECRVSQQVQLAGADGSPAQAWLTLGEVVGVHIDRRFLNEGVYDTAAARPILRAGGPGGYVEIGPGIMFEMPRPENPPKAS